MIGFLFIFLKSIVSLITLTILYLISIKPRLHGRPDYKPFFGHMYAHRGLHNMSPAIQKLKNLENIDNASEKLPENSYAAIRRAATSVMASSSTYISPKMTFLSFFTTIPSAACAASREI